MQNPFLDLIKKLDHPPAAPNWVRFIHQDPLKSAKAIIEFAFAQVTWNYKPAYAAIKDRIELGLDRHTAILNVSKRGNPRGREHNKLLVEAFFDHDDQRQYRCQNAIGFEREYFHVSRDINVPVAPLSIIRENGRFVPIFVCGWNSIPFSLFQRRLLMTIYEDAFLSLTDFQDSPAEILFFPKTQLDDGRRRKVEIWTRSDYDLLSHKSINEAAGIFLLARDIALQKLQVLAKDWDKSNGGGHHPTEGDGLI
jgi:hypothetical protein